MKIALLTYSTRPRGGVVHTLALAEALASLGEEVHVWTLARGGDRTFFRDVHPSVVIHAVPFECPDPDVGARIIASIETLGAALTEHRDDYDVVHAQDCISANAALRGDGADLPLVRTIHHLDQFTTPQLVACHERAVVAPTTLVCVSSAVAQEVWDGWGLHPAVIANGVDAARFSGARNDAVGRRRWRRRLGRYVLALGGIEPRKGTIDLLEAFAGIEPNHADVRLVLAGGETLFDYRGYREAFDRRATELGVRPEMLGPVDDADLPALVAEASAVGFVSTKEGFGLAAMEALAAGVPVVARDLPVLREVFGEAVTYGTDVPGFTDALDRVLRDPPDPRRGIGLAGAYTWTDAARAHQDLYRGLVR